MNKIEILEDLVGDSNNHVKLHKLFIDEIMELEQMALSSELIKRKDHPNQESLVMALNEYEMQYDELITLLTNLIRYYKGDLNEIVLEVLHRVLNIPKNDLDGYGYIWRHLSNYPVLLLSYSIGIMSLKFERYELLYKTMNITIKQRYFGRDFMEYFDSSLIEGINSYHVFNNVDNITVDIFPYLPNENNSTNDTRKRLNVNNRIYKYLKPIMAYFFISESDFDDYFDLYEFFLGLDFMDKRINKNGGLFAPYGRRFWMYSESGRYFNYRDTIVHKFLNDIEKYRNNILDIGFFGNSKERFKNALNEYKILLQRISSF